MNSTYITEHWRNVWGPWLVPLSLGHVTVQQPWASWAARPQLRLSLPGPIMRWEDHPGDCTVLRQDFGTLETGLQMCWEEAVAGCSLRGAVATTNALSERWAGMSSSAKTGCRLLLSHADTSRLEVASSLPLVKYFQRQRPTKTGIQSWFVEAFCMLTVTRPLLKNVYWALRMWQVAHKTWDTVPARWAYNLI